MVRRNLKLSLDGLVGPRPERDRHRYVTKDSTTTGRPAQVPGNRWFSDRGGALGSDGPAKSPVRQHTLYPMGTTPRKR
jgi:hypothetical protein